MKKTNIIKLTIPNPPNPFPLPSPHALDISNDLCGLCNFVVKDDQKSINCDKCYKWVHIKCSNVSNDQYEFYQENNTETFECITCRSNECGLCDKIIDIHHKALKCNECLKWVHVKCTNISNIKYENYQINPEMKFQCRSCKSCGICKKTIAINHRKLKCDVCCSYIHMKCNKFEEKDYNYYKSNNDPFFCVQCLKDNLPLTSIKDKEFELTIKGIKIPNETDLETMYLKNEQVGLVNKLNKVVTDYNNDISDNDECNFMEIL